MKNRLLIVVFLAGVSLPGCESNVCTLLPCTGHLTLHLRSNIESANYSIDIAKNGQKFNCSFSGSDQSPPCNSPLSVNVSTKEIEISLLTGMGEAPEGIQVLLSKDDAVVVEKTVKPIWSEPYYPNGEECDEGNGCRSAEETIAF